jgi:hypothetical protein
MLIIQPTGNTMLRLGYLYKPGTYDKAATIFIDNNLIIHTQYGDRTIRYRRLGTAILLSKGLEFIPD